MSEGQWQPYIYYTYYPGQALSGAKAIATRTLPLCTQDHMAALLPQGCRNLGLRGARGERLPPYLYFG